ncbi:MAG: AraC family transcriptional regulator [Sporolactobacillus sp.]
MKKDDLYFVKPMANDYLGMDIYLKEDLPSGKNFRMHWHEHLQIYYFLSGDSLLQCGKQRYSAHQGSIAVINSNELHYIESRSDALRFYIIWIDIQFLFSRQTDLCQANYFAPLAQNRILFQNLIENDPSFAQTLQQLIQSFRSRQIGFEIEIKALVYLLIVRLLRQHINQIASSERAASQTNRLNHFKRVFDYLDQHFMEPIDSHVLAEQMHISLSHYCRVFKALTGKSTTEYVNALRLEHAARLLKSGMTVTEAAFSSGFDNLNYFSRRFRRDYGITPSAFKNK